tara:strand:- start:405 stop:560 length:156 start_codon:yes stop_codon:yes gene_type:complete
MEIIGIIVKNANMKDCHMVVPEYASIIRQDIRVKNVLVQAYANMELTNTIV